MKLRHSWSILIIFIFLLSCSSSVRLEEHIYYRLSANPTTLDPALIVDVSGASIASKIFSGLVRLNDDLEIIPDIADRWIISKDGKKYRFFIKRGIKFSNGREVMARDFKYSFQRVLDPKTKSPNTWVFERVKGAREFRGGLANEVRGFSILDEYTFEIVLERPFSPFLSMLTMTPAYVVPEEEVKRVGDDFSSNPSGSGPFVLKRWLHNRELVLEKNEDYSGEMPKVRGIVYRIIPEDLTALTEFEIGNIDVISLPASAYSKFRNDKRWSRHIVNINGLNTYYLGLNSSRSPFDNPAFRRAVFYAIDRKKILETFYEGRGRLANGPVPDMLRKWDVKETYSYRPEKAKEIIRELNLSGIKVKMYVTSDQEVVDLSEIIQWYLSDVGIEVIIKQLEWSAYKEAINNGEPDMFWLSWWADYPDAENFLFPLFHSSNIGPAGNRTRYRNIEVDRLIEKGQYSINEKDRNSFYQSAEEIIIKDAPWVFFWHRTDFIIKQPWIKGYKVYPIYSMDKGLSVEISR